MSFDGADGEGGFPARPSVTGPVRGRVPSRVQVNREITIQQRLIQAAG
jgi:hypothetical protein